MNQQKQAKLGVGAVVFHQNRVLLVKRVSPPFAGQRAIPGGKVQFGESLKQAAEREVLEETSVIIQAGEPIFTFEIIQNSTAGPHLHYVVIDLEAHYISGDPRSGDDASAAAWVGPIEIKTMSVNQTTLELLKTKYNFPA